MIPAEELSEMVFYHKDPSTGPKTIDVSKQTFFSFKHVMVSKQDHQAFSLLTVSDITENIRFIKLKQENYTLQMVNATVSHEMRNPLNSITSQNLKMRELLLLVKGLMASKMQMRNLKKEMRLLLDEFDESLTIQDSSIKMLNFCVHDMLSLA